MSLPEDIKDKLYKSLYLYDEEYYYDNYIRKAYDDDNVLIKKGVKLYNIITSFNLKNRKFYKDIDDKINKKNDYKNIELLQSNKNPYKINILRYKLDNFDYGCDKYDKLNLEETEEIYKYDNDKGRYIKYSTLSGGNRYNYNLTYNDLKCKTYNTIEDVVKNIKELEKLRNLK